MEYPKVFVERGVQTVSPPSATASPSTVDNHDNDAYNQSSVSLMHAPLISRRAPTMHTSRRSEVRDVERRVVSMPLDKPAQHLIFDHPIGSRVVSMPEYFATVDLSLDSTDSYSIGASFDYGVEKRRVKVRPTSSDAPHTPSPQSSPDSVLIINNHAQLSDGFLRKNYLPKKTTASSDGWMAWTSSPPRPIPALHGPLSLPYARCPSGAEGTIIEEPDNVSRMIWGLGPDEYSRQYRADREHTDNEINCITTPHSRVPPRMQKTHTLQKPLQVRAATNNKRTYKGDTGVGASTVHRLLDHERGSYPLELKGEQPIQGLQLARSWLAEPGVQTIREPEVEERGFDSSFNDQGLLMRLALVQRSLQNTALNQSYSEGFKPIYPVSNHPRVAPAYPKILVEQRHNEVIDASQRQSGMDSSRQYHQQEFRLKQQRALPTPPSSSSPQWSSNFSPYQYPSVSPEVNMQRATGLPYHNTQAQHPFVDATYQTRNFLYDRQNNGTTIPHFFDGSGDSRSLPSMDSSGDLANYLRDLRTSTLAQQSVYAGIVSPNLPPFVAATCGTSHNVVPVAPPSPDSPGSRSHSVLYQQPRSVPLARLMRRRLSSVLEEDSSGLVDTLPTSEYRFIDGCQGSFSSREHSDDNAAPRRYHQGQHLNVPPARDHGRVSVTNTVDDYERHPYAFPLGASPAKVRLPSTHDQEMYTVQSQYKEMRTAGSSQQLKKKTRGRRTRDGV